MSAPPPSAPCEGIERYGPGERCTTARPADFLLTHGDDWMDRAIQIGQGLRYRGADARFARWNHVALVADVATLVEAIGTGVVLSPLAKYDAVEYHLVRIEASAADRAEAVTFARACLQQGYGYLTVASIAFSLATGATLAFGFDGQQICSGLVARALERTTAIFKREPSHLIPADLAKLYGVEA